MKPESRAEILDRINRSRDQRERDAEIPGLVLRKTWRVNWEDGLSRLFKKLLRRGK